MNPNTKTEQEIKRLEHKFEWVPYTGRGNDMCTEFDDRKLFIDQNNKPMWEFAVLKSIKLWYGMPSQNIEEKDEKGKHKASICDYEYDFPKKQKMVLGVELKYINTSNGEVRHVRHTCNISESTETEQSEYELAEGEFFCKVEFRYNNCFFEYMKFITNKNNFVQIGKNDQSTEKFIKHVTLNDSNEPYIIQCFIGKVDKLGLRVVAMKKITRNNYIFVHMMGVLRLRHRIKQNKEEEAKWKKRDELNRLRSDAERAVALVCLLPDNHFTNVMMYSA